MDTFDSNLDAFLEASQHVGGLIVSDQVGSAWDRPSALDLMTVGALVGHIFLVVRRVGLRAQAATAHPVGPGLRVGSAPLSGWTWPRVEGPADLDQPLHRQVRHDAETVAEWGWAAVRDAYSERVSLVEALLRRSQPTSVEVGGRPLTLAAYLATRVVELLVHGDDLACSVGLEAPEPPAGMDIAIRTMVEAARSTHGDLTVLRHLTRRERAIGRISVF